jgi:hypothetical protein
VCKRWKIKVNIRRGECSSFCHRITQNVFKKKPIWGLEEEEKKENKREIVIKKLTEMFNRTSKMSRFGIFSVNKKESGLKRNEEIFKSIFKMSRS